MRVVSPPHDNDSERGAISVSILLALVAVGLVVYLALAATDADPARYGSVRVPGEAQFELPGGDANYYYSEQSTGHDVAAPSDLEVTVTDQDGQAVKSDTRSSDDQSDDDGRRVDLIGQVDPPSEGLYTVTVETSTPAASLGPDPQISFGESPFGAVGDRWEEVLDWLKGPAGIVVIVLLLGLLVWPSLKRRSEASKYRDDY
jgi:hypothetical protein